MTALRVCSTEKRYKRIGYIVEYKTGARRECWDTLCSPRFIKSAAVNEFDLRCQFHWIPKGVILKYNWLKKRGLARCVPVYVEVQDG